jgi:hypothetical protein
MHVKPDFITVLESSRYLDSTDPRDKIYGLLWALGELQLPPPDYSKSVAQVYEQATVGLIRRFGNSSSSLEPLYWVNGVDRPADLPSWVPNWDNKGQLNHQYAPFDFPTYNFRIMTKDHTSRPPEFPTPGALKLYGQVLCYVRTVSDYHSVHAVNDILPEERITVEGEDAEALNISDISSRRLQAIYVAALSLQSCIRNAMNAATASEEGPLYISTEKMPWVLYFVLGEAFLSPTTEAEPDPWVHFESFCTWLDLMLAIQPNRDAWIQETSTIIRNKLPERAEEILDDTLYLFKSDISLQSTGDRGLRGLFVQTLFSNPGLLGFFTSVRKTMERRALFTCEEGEIGNAFHEIRPGDMVCLFAGSRLPLVVRPTVEGCFDDYRLVGPAYVHACMNGGLLDDDESLLDEFLIV